MQILKKSLPEMAESNPLSLQLYIKKSLMVLFCRVCEALKMELSYQLQLRELDAILKNASLYLPFLAQQQCDGYTPLRRLEKHLNSVFRIMSVH